MLEALYASTFASALILPDRMLLTQLHGLLQIDLVKGMMDCLYAECTPCITDCVMAELEKLGQKYRVALKVAKVSACPNLQMHKV